MAYWESQIDKDNKRWFNSDKSRNTLLKLTISKGQIRGITPVEIQFKYPITAIVGENGAGKSTILALAACSFHNNTDFFPQNRIRTHAKKPRQYYTYVDFFTFSPDEKGIEGITIKADYLAADGIQSDIRKKKPSGKWNDFNRRPKRAVAYMGINRIVPPSESNPHRHYYRKFVNCPLSDAQLEQLRSSMTAILGRQYEKITLQEAGTYRLFEAKRGDLIYTGFNMGAGENAVLGLILEILNAKDGALIVVDEIELGLHTQAQIRLIDELKKLCLKYKCQIICSTHSKEILGKLPPEARIFLTRSDKKTLVIPEISPEYAFGKLSGENSEELFVFTEDEVGKDFLTNMLPKAIRERIRIIPVGSDQAVLKHMAVHYRENTSKYICFLDGDKRSEKSQAIRQIKKHLEDRVGDNFEEEMQKRLNYLPGDCWPEKELVTFVRNSQDTQKLVETWGIDSDDINVLMEEALAAGKHNEFHSLAKSIHLQSNQIRTDIIRFYALKNQELITGIENTINGLLD